MQVNCIKAVYFSATGNTKKIVTSIADVLARALNTSLDVRDFTLPQDRKDSLTFSAGDLVVLGTPVYAGRVPNVLLKYLDTIDGSGALAIPVVTFGNRWYDDALAELTCLLRNGGLRPVAAGAFVGEHAFSSVLGQGRPDQADLLLAARFAEETARMIATLPEDAPVPMVQPGRPQMEWVYYQPKDKDGAPIDIRKVKPVVNESCNHCGLCAAVCPMGSIGPDDVTQYTGICIKCGACIKKCPQQARDYTDSGYLYHKTDLEQSLTRRAEPEWFLASPDDGRS